MNKYLLVFLFALSARAAQPPYQAFNTNDFQITPHMISLQPGVKLWTNSAGNYQPTSAQASLTATGILSQVTLTSGGAFLLGQTGKLLLTGTDNLTNLNQSYIRLTSQTTNSADTTLRLQTGNGIGSVLVLQHGDTNSFQLLNGSPLWDDASQHVYLPMGDWKPTQIGEGLLLLNTGIGWEALERFQANTNILTAQLWQESFGNLSPTDTNAAVVLENTNYVNFYGQLDITNNNPSLFQGQAGYDSIHGNAPYANLFVQTSNDPFVTADYIDILAETNQTHIIITVDNNDLSQLKPVAADGVTPYNFDTALTHTTGSLFKVGNNGSLRFSVGANSGYTGAGTKMFTDDGTFKPIGSVSATNVIWGQINGVLSNQTDLWTYLQSIGNYWTFTGGYLREAASISTNYLAIRDAGVGAGIQLTEPVTHFITFDQGTSGYTFFSNIGGSGNPTVTIGNGALNSQYNNLGSANPMQNYGLFAQNTYAASAGQQQNSPAVVWTGQGWGTNSATSQQVSFGAFVVPSAGADTPTGVLKMFSLISNSVPSQIFALQSASGWDGSSTKFLAADGYYHTAGGGGSSVCGGTLTNYMLVYNGTCITNSQVQATTNGLASPEVDSGSLFVTNINNGVVVANSHTLTNVLPTVGYLYYNGTNYSFTTSTTALTSGFYGGLTNADYLTTDSYADVVFANVTDTNVVATTTLTPGTWLITANIVWNTYRTAGQQLYIQLYDTETGAPVDKSERLVGPAVATAVYGEWPIQLQSLISVSSTAVIKVQAHNAVPGDTQTQVRSAQTTLSWLKTN